MSIIFYGSFNFFLVGYVRLNIRFRVVGKDNPEIRVGSTRVDDGRFRVSVAWSGSRAVVGDKRVGNN